MAESKTVKVTSCTHCPGTSFTKADTPYCSLMFRIESDEELMPRLRALTQDQIGGASGPPKWCPLKASPQVILEMPHKHFSTQPIKRAGDTFAERMKARRDRKRDE